MIERALDRIDELSALFAALLRIGEVERGGVDAPTAPLDVASLARDMFEAYAPAVEDSGRTLELDAPGPAPATGDRLLVAQAVSNLLDNAVVHTPVGTRVSIRVAVRGGDVRLSVVDDGPGVPAADLDRIVERFVRLDRDGSRPGHGLGLNMVSVIANASGGRFEVTDARPGLGATMILPEWSPRPNRVPLPRAPDHSPSGRERPPARVALRSALWTGLGRTTGRLRRWCNERLRTALPLHESQQVGIEPTDS